MKKILFIVSILFITHQSNAQHAISGTLTDNKNNPLKDVSVFIPEFQKYDLTKENGSYELKNVGEGTVTIQFSKLGYKTVIQTINTAEASQPINVSMETTSME